VKNAFSLRLRALRASAVKSPFLEPGQRAGFLVFLGVDHGKRSGVHDVLDVAVALQNVDGFARAHEDRPDGLGSTEF
jgi:hypothetical protein